MLNANKFEYIKYFDGPDDIHISPSDHGSTQVGQMALISHTLDLVQSETKQNYII